MRKLNILQLYSDCRWTGPAEPVLSLSRELAKRGHRVLFAYRGGGPLESRAGKEDVDTITDLKLNRYFNFSDNIHDLVTLPKILKRYRVDIIHTHLSHDHLMGALANIHNRKCLVRTVHEAAPRRRMPGEGILFKGMTKGIITVCESARRELINGLSLSPERVKTIYGAVDIERFSPSIKGNRVRQEFGLSEDVPVAGVVARFHDHGKHSYFLEAIPEVKKAVPRAKFFLVGRGKYRSVLEDMIKRLGIIEEVIFTGQRYEDYPEVLAAMDVKVYLIAGTDGSCRAVLEAMAMGKPVVAAPVGSIPDMARDGFPGLVVNPEDKTALAKAVAALLKDKALAKRKGERGRRLVEKYFREDMRAEKVEEVYASLL